MRIPLLDLQPQHAGLRDDLLAVITRVLDNNQFILGPEVPRLEGAVARLCGVAHGIGVSSGTDALLASLMALEIGPGDLVLTTPYTFFATMGTVLRLGARPIFVDIEPRGFNIDPEQLAEALAADTRVGRRIKAIIPVHLFGQCADMARILPLAARYGVPVIEDAAQAIGAACPLSGDDGGVCWHQAGGMGLMGCFSFFPSKNLGGIGDGGMIVTNDAELAECLRTLRNHGAKPKYMHGRVGGNFRLDTIQAAVLEVKLQHLADWHRARAENARRYRELFAAAGLIGTIRLPEELYAGQPGAEGQLHHIYNQFVIRCSERDALQRHLLQHEIGCEVYYPLALHQQACLAGGGYEGLSFPVAETAARESLALPVYPGLTHEMQQVVVETIASFFAP
ncbi:MAG: transcriptional regulator [Desulfobulbaceae bacterium A2]|nr:MAG: transcriptional regulator [Desulfobulbaceae bacterium A2]